MRYVLALLAIATATATARAEPDDIVTRPLVLPRGGFLAALTAEIELAPHLVAEPLQLAPDVWYGVTSRLTVGLVHSDPSLDRIQTGRTFCFTHGTLTCTHFYGGSGLDARYQLHPAIAPRIRVLVRETDPFEPAVTLGALVHVHRTRFALTADPYLQLGLANTSSGNRAQLWLPVVLSLQPTCRWLLSLHTGMNSELATWPDAIRIPIGISATARITRTLDGSALFGFPSLLGPQNTPKRRALFLSVSVRL
jgi:hypothetical protein